MASNTIGNSQRRENTKRIGRPAMRTGKGHPRKQARIARALAREAAGRQADIIQAATGGPDFTEKD